MQQGTLDQRGIRRLAEHVVADRSGLGLTGFHRHVANGTDVLPSVMDREDRVGPFDGGEILVQGPQEVLLLRLFRCRSQQFYIRHSLSYLW